MNRVLVQAGKGLAIAILWSAAASAGPTDRRQDIDLFLSQVPIEGGSLHEAVRLASLPGTFDHVSILLKDRARKELWLGAVTLMGLTGDPRAFAELREFLRGRPIEAIERRRCGLDETPSREYCVSRGVYEARAKVPVAMGFLLFQLSQRPEQAGQAVEEIRSFLARYASPRTQPWSELIDWRCEEFQIGDRYHQDIMAIELSRAVIQGMANSGDEKLAEELILLRDKHLPSLVSRVGSAGAQKRAADHPYSPVLLKPEILAETGRLIQEAIERNHKVRESRSLVVVQ